MDGNSAANGYRCRDQLGSGTDDPTTGAQGLDPVYLWDNYYCYGPGGNCNPEPSPTGTGVAPRLYISTGSEHIIKNRDYYEGRPKPGYTPYVYPHPETMKRPAPPTGIRVD